jgi:hypothetical protein
MASVEAMLTCPSARLLSRIAKALRSIEISASTTVALVDQ